MQSVNLLPPILSGALLIEALEMAGESFDERNMPAS
jgi:hypothetical protein